MLGEPHGKVFFAGEATALEDMQMTHGALFSGLRGLLLCLSVYILTIYTYGYYGAMLLSHLLNFYWRLLCNACFPDCFPLLIGIVSG